MKSKEKAALEGEFAQRSHRIERERIGRRKAETLGSAAHAGWTVREAASTLPRSCP
jgi:hypothetical protein